MVRANDSLLGLPGGYLFAEVARRVRRYTSSHAARKVISLGIGDVTHPLVPAVVAAMHKAAEDMSRADTFHGYGPAGGYAFLREAICSHDYAARGMDIAPDEIFVSAGAKEDVSQFQSLFDRNCTVAVADPVYPVYVEANAMAGRAGLWNGSQWDRIVYLPCTAANGFMPEPPSVHVDLIYLCCPNNPTGTAMSRDALKEWVDYAHRTGAIILYDSAYEAFISDPAIPHSIFEIDGAREVAAEFRSFSKTAGFTGVRCAYTVVPRELSVTDENGNPFPLNQLWKRHQDACFNGCSYPAQRAAEAAYSASGSLQLRGVINGYLANAAMILDAFRSMGYTAVGGVNAPYVWVETPNKMPSWDFFDLMLDKTGVVCTPGAGFGLCGEGFIRLTAFGTHDETKEALARLAEL